MHLLVDVQIGWGWSRHGVKWVGQMFSFIFYCVYRKGREGRTLLAVKLQLHPGLGTVLWCHLRDRDVRNSFGGCYLSGSNSTETSSASLNLGWENLSKDNWLIKSRNMLQSLAQTVVQPVFLTSDKAMSSTGLDELAIMPPCVSEHAAHCTGINNWGGPVPIQELQG